MTLNGVMALILRYFTEFGSFQGTLHKSSHSLSHLLMSSCIRKSYSLTYAVSLYWLQVPQGIQYQLAVVIYKVLHGDAPRTNSWSPHPWWWSAQWMNTWVCQHQPSCGTTGQTVNCWQQHLCSCCCSRLEWRHFSRFTFWRLLVHGQVTIIFVVSVCLFVCLFVQSFVSRLWSDFDQTRTYVICLGLLVSRRI